MFLKNDNKIIYTRNALLVPTKKSEKGMAGIKIPTIKLNSISSWKYINFSAASPKSEIDVRRFKMGKRVKNKRKAKNRRIEQDALEQEDFLNDEVFGLEIGFIPVETLQTIEELENKWYERLVCKRLAEQIQNRKLGMRI